MKFDTIIIGGGLSALVCGIRLQQEGQRCLIVSAGQSALHFSSGSLDLLNKMPGGGSIADPCREIEKLTSAAPLHPYSKMGADNFRRLVPQAKELLESVGIRMIGGSENHYRITPMGNLLPTWLTLDGYATSSLPDSLPWKRVVIFAIMGFMDFFEGYVAKGFSHMGTEARVHYFTLSEINELRRNPSELRSTNIARALDRHDNADELIRIINENSGDAEAVMLPACIGSGRKLWDRLKEGVDKPVFVVPTMPPSTAGIDMQKTMKEHFLHNGGVYMLGDMVVRGDIEDNRVKRIYTYNHGDIAFEADNFVLVTGSYFSQGLIAGTDKITEPVFGLDVKQSEGRESWSAESLFDRQAYQSFGVETDPCFRAVKDGGTLSNLYAAGAILPDFDPIFEGSGGGVSMLTAMYVAEHIVTANEN